MKEIVFITPADVRYGFAAAGVRQRVTRPEQALAELRAVLADPDTALAVLDERLVEAVGEKELAQLEACWKGILLVMPAPEKTEAEGEDYIRRLIRRALGYQVRLEP